ncbi:MAG: DNA methyltransferase [Flavobacteriaceae bacterium]|nr:DNA methyltransferase [Flavobacteriaceae bacterium]MCY4253170.1 DNA methyltransferase [Flavobacteriaceae bacterium]
MNSESVDLIATDPPFNKGRDFQATPSSLKQGGGKFSDKWRWNQDVEKEWLDQIKDDNPDIWEVVDATNQIHMRKTKKNLLKDRNEVGSDMGTFLCFMAVRLLEMRRVLKPTGSIYLHCDYSASHYLKLVMDAIFGKKNFRNEIIWCYKTGGTSKKYFSKKHDIIFFYSKTDKYHFNTQQQKAYTKVKSRQPGIVNLGQGTNEFFRDENGVYQYVNAYDYWEIPALNSQAKERTGYPTQKPPQLYEKIIKASSNEGDIVLDPFCGCATTLVAAERLGRQWVGIDIWEEAHEIVYKKIKNEVIYDEIDELHRPKGNPIYQKDFPNRTDNKEVGSPYLQTKKILKQDPFKDRFKSNNERKDYLIKKDRFVCQGCGYIPLFGQIECETSRIEIGKRQLELDHDEPRSTGGSNYIYNRILLCKSCNGIKSNTLNLIGLRKEVKTRGLMVNEKKIIHRNNLKTRKENLKNDADLLRNS